MDGTTPAPCRPQWQGVEEIEREEEREREKYSFIQISYNKIITIIIKTAIIKRAQKDSKKEKRREAYQGISTHKLLLNNTRVEAFFYTVCPGGHQRSQLFPIYVKM